MTKTKRWKPKKGEKYWAIDEYARIWRYRYNDDTCDRAFYSIGNYFRTKKEAESAAEKFKAMLMSLHIPSTECSQLPKLTVEVFDRADCPKWVKYAAVNANGKVVIFSDIPTQRDDGWSVIWHSTSTQADVLGDVRFDASDWENSLIERPVVLPDWCKVGEWIYIPAIEEYMQIKKVEDDLLFDKEGCHIPYTDCNQARPRPYNEDEMKALVGKPITMSDGAVCLCTAYSKQRKLVILDNIHWDAQQLMDSGCTIDDKPCGVLKHLNEKGEWVE